MKKRRIILALILWLTSFNVYAEEAINKEDSPIELPKEEVIGLEATVNEFREFKKHANNIELNGKYLKRVGFHGVYQGNIAFDDTTGSSERRSKYKVPYADLYMEGEFQDNKTDFFVRINPARHLKDYNYLNTAISDFYIRRKLSENNTILVGQSPTPIGMEGGQSPYTLLFANRSQIARTYGTLRAIGVRNVGRYDYMDYDIGVYDSTRYLKDPLKGAEVTSWLTFKPLAKTEKKFGDVKFGTGVNTGERYNHDYTVLGSYVQYDYKKFMANLEFANADGYNGVYASTNKSNGYYSTLAYHITPKLQVLGRYDHFDPNTKTANNWGDEYTAGINYYIKGQAAKIALNYVYRKQENNINSNRYIMMTQFMF